MPTDQIDDVEISAVLNQAEPPKSPKHLDTAILKYAKEKATESAPGQDGGASWLSLSWLQENWMSAAATLSVAAIGVAISLQIFTEPDLQSAAKAGRAEIALSDSVPTRQSAPASVAVETEEQPRPSAAVSSPRSLAAGAVAAQSVEVRRVLEDANLSQAATASSLDSTSSAVQAEIAAVGASSNAAQVIEELAEADDRVEEALAATSSASSGVRSRPALTQEQPPSFAEDLVEDAGLRETVIIVLRRSLGVREQSAIAVQREFSLQVNPLVETYRELSDPGVLLNIQNRYSVARSERLDSRLPETVGELVSLLEDL